MAVETVIFAVLVCIGTVLVFCVVALLLVRLGESVVVREGDDDRPPRAAAQRDADTHNGPDQESDRKDRGHDASGAGGPVDGEGDAGRKGTLRGPPD